MTLFLPIGPPGAGKSTLASWAVATGFLSEDAIVCPDTIRQWLTGDRSNQAHNQAVFTIVWTVVLNRLELDQDVFLDATNLNQTERYIAKAVEHNHRVIVITFDISDEELERRNQIREHPVPDFVLDRMIARSKTGQSFPETVEVFSSTEFYDVFLAPKA